MSQLPLRSIEAFVLVARVLSLQKAATALNITVPAVSRRIQLLERHLGTRLFDRLPRGLALTPAGESYIADLGPAWDAVQAATASAPGRGAMRSRSPSFRRSPSTGCYRASHAVGPQEWKSRSRPCRTSSTCRHVPTSTARSGSAVDPGQTRRARPCFPWRPIPSPALSSLQPSECGAPRISSCIP